MEAIFVLVAFALGLSVILRALDELIPFHTPLAVSRAVAVVVGIGAAWVLDYSVFAAFGQELRAEWMHPVATGLALVATAELITAAVRALRSRTGEVTASPRTPVKTA